MIDSHTHLFLCEGEEAELLGAAAAAGVERMLTVGLDEETNAVAIASAERNAGVFAAVGRHPNEAGGFDDEAAAAIARLAAHEKVRAIGETGLDYYRDTAAPEDQRRAYELAEIRRWLVVFVRRFFGNQFKRSALPSGPKVSSGGTMSPRGDWRMPSDADPSAWLAEIEANVPVL